MKAMNNAENTDIYEEVGEACGELGRIGGATPVSRLKVSATSAWQGSLGAEGARSAGSQMRVEQAELTEEHLHEGGGSPSQEAEVEEPGEGSDWSKTDDATDRRGMSVPSKSDRTGEITPAARRIGHTTTSIKRYVTVKKKVKKKVKRKRPRSRAGSQAAGSQASQQHSEFRTEYEYADASNPVPSVDPSEGGPLGPVGSQAQASDSVGRRYQSQDDDDRPARLLQAPQRSPARDDEHLSARASSRRQQMQQMREDVSRINQNARLGVGGLAPQQAKTKREIIRQANIQMYRDEVRSHYLEQKQQQMLRAKKAAGMEPGDADQAEESPHERRRRELMKYQTEKAPGESIGAYFFKRKHRFLEEEKKGGFSFAKVFSAIGKSSKYVKRYFKIDTVNGTLAYAEEEQEASTKPQYQVTFGNLKGVKADVVSMPSLDGSGFSQVSTKGKSHDAKDVDMGPAGCNHAFEIYLTDRTFTLYSDNQRDVNSFVTLINEILNHKEKVLESQKQLDEQMKEELEIQKKRNEEQAKLYLRKLAGLPTSNIPRPQQRPSSQPAAEAKQQDRRSQPEGDPRDLKKPTGIRSQSAAGPEVHLESDKKQNRAPPGGGPAPRLPRQDASRLSKEDSSGAAASKRPQDDVIQQRHKQIEKIMNNKESTESKETDGTKKSSKRGRGTKKKKKNKRKSRSRTRQSAKQKKLKEKYDIQSFASGSGEEEQSQQMSQESMEGSSPSIGPESKSSISPINRRKADLSKGPANMPPRDPNHQAPSTRNVTQHLDSLNRSGAASGAASTNFHQEISSGRGSDIRRSQFDNLNDSAAGAHPQTQRATERSQDGSKKDVMGMDNSQTSQAQKSQLNFSAASEFEDRKQQIFDDMMQKRKTKRDEIKRKYEDRPNASRERPPTSPRINTGIMRDRSAEKPPKSPKIQKVNAAERPPKSPKLSAKNKKAPPAEPEDHEKLIDNRLKEVQNQIDSLNKQKQELAAKHPEVKKKEKADITSKEVEQKQSPKRMGDAQKEERQLQEVKKEAPEPLVEQAATPKPPPQSAAKEGPSVAASKQSLPAEAPREVEQVKETPKEPEEDVGAAQESRGQAEQNDQVEVTQVQKFEMLSPDDAKDAVAEAPTVRQEASRADALKESEAETPEDEQIEIQQLYQRRDDIILPVFEKEPDKLDITNKSKKQNDDEAASPRSPESSALTIELQNDQEPPVSAPAPLQFYAPAEVSVEKKIEEPAPKPKLVKKSAPKREAPLKRTEKWDEAPSSPSAARPPGLKAKEAAAAYEPAGARIKLNKHKSKSQAEIAVPDASGTSPDSAHRRQLSNLPAQKTDTPNIIAEGELVEPGRRASRTAAKKRYETDLDGSGNGDGDAPQAKSQHRSRSVRDRPTVKLQLLPVPYQPPKPLQLGDGTNTEFLNGQKYSDANLMKSIFKRLEVLMVDDLHEVDEGGRDAGAELDEVSSRDDPMLGSSSNNTATNRSLDRQGDGQRETAPVLPFKDHDDMLGSTDDFEQSLAHFGGVQPPVPPLNLQVLRNPQPTSPQAQLAQNVKRSICKASSRYDHPSESDYISSKVPIEQSNLVVEDYSYEDDHISPLRKAGGAAAQTQLGQQLKRPRMEAQGKNGEPNFQETFGTQSNVKFSASALEDHGNASVFDLYSRQQHTADDGAQGPDYFQAIDDAKRSTGYFRRLAEGSGQERASRASAGEKAGARRRSSGALGSADDDEAHRDDQLRLLLQMGHTATAGQETKMDGAANQQNPTSRPKKTELEDIDEWDTPETPAESNSPYDDQQGGNSIHPGASDGLGKNNRGAPNQQNRGQTGLAPALDSKAPSTKGLRTPGVPILSSVDNQHSLAKNGQDGKQGTIPRALGHGQQPLPAVPSKDEEETSSLEDW